jgi:hypothetical protein
MFLITDISSFQSSDVSKSIPLRVKIEKFSYLQLNSSSLWNSLPWNILYSATSERRTRLHLVALQHTWKIVMQLIARRKLFNMCDMIFLYPLWRAFTKWFCYPDFITAIVAFLQIVDRLLRLSDLHPLYQSILYGNVHFKNSTSSIEKRIDWIAFLVYRLYFIV